MKEKQLFLDFQEGNLAAFEYFFDKYLDAYRIQKSNSELLVLAPGGFAALIVIDEEILF